MLILVLVILAVVFSVCLWMEATMRCNDLLIAPALISAFGFVAVFVVTIFIALGAAASMTVDEKIAMYEEENAKIELQIAETVKQYQAYENEIFMEVSPDDSVMVVAAYPELKSDELVQQQIQIYFANNEKIKELKEDKIDLEVKKWLLYFGG